jgi:glycosyltransferase involved in cell wall biosynthesis
MSKEQNIRLCALMLDPYDTSPGQRFRLEQWEPFLRKAGITIDYFSFTDENFRKIIYKEGHTAAKVKELLKANVRRLGHIFKASEYDAIYLYRAANMVGPAWMERFLSWRKTPVIFDFDDAIFLTDTSKANKKFGWAKFSGKTADICRLSAHVTVGNSYLAEYALRYNKNVHIVPTSIDTNRYQPVSKEPNKTERVIVGWTGSSTSQYHLEEFEPVLAELVKRHDNVEIRVISDREPDFKEVPFVWRQWTAQTEVEETSHFDIGIMPLPDNEWTRGKCAAKALICMSLGIPAICSDVGANRDVIRHGENGFLAKDKEAWLKSFETLIADPQLRIKMGHQARRTVVEGYSMEKCADLFADVVLSLKQKNEESRKAA